ncbi:FecR family protein [Pedobacter nyackensis]|uniref:FecR family protein n=1 Tax=Pedobacter nyackensis TaxID=475255 RepID=A0A1W2F5M8_9SPHI|nr:FecR family protein [Pedobacter nyackensis]SMD17217.1 FecR family protein [Pedobacter nyackensis]
MNMEFERAEKLIEKYNSGKAKPEERALLESWYLKYKTGETLSPEDLQQEHDLGLHKLNGYLDGAQKIKLWPRIASVAAILLVLSAGLYFYNTRYISIKDKISLAQDIPPGKNTAILTLANGKTINLSDAKRGVVVKEGKLVYNDGTGVESPGNDKQASSLEMTAHTPRGGMYNVTLPDGTIVMLNAESSLKFPSVFVGKNRVVELQGEAYFEVTKDKVHPFVVKSEGQTIEVLGTHFNVNSYQTNRFVKTTLLEGSVKVKGSNNEVVLIPGQQAKLGAGQLNVQQVDPEDAVSWKNGYFRFNDERIQSVMQQIARWYNIEVVYKDNPTEEGFTGTISRSSNISDVLSMLERTKTVHFDIEGRRVMVMN